MPTAQKHAPLRQRRVKHEHKPWLTNEIKQLIFHRDYLKRQSVRVLSTDYHAAYKRCKNRVNKLIESIKKDHFKKRLTNSSNSKESWQAINELLNRKPKPTRVNKIIEDDKIITKNEDIANSFNQYFSSIGCKLSDNIRDDGTDPLSFVTPMANTFNFSPITTEEVIEALSQLSPKKAPGIDGISVRLLRDTVDVIAEPLANIFNLSLRTAIFPDDWKLAKISPIFKDGTKNDCGNYRPISVISTVAKLFEGVVYHQLRSFIAANNLDLVFFFKAVNGLVDVSHDVLPEVISETRTTRSSSGNQISFRPAKCKTTTYQRSFFIRATRTWNSLPPTLRSPGINIRQFKTDLQNYYLIALRECFNEEDPRTWKTICLKCNTSRHLRSKLTCCF